MLHSKEQLPNLSTSDMQDDHNVLALLFHLKDITMGRFNSGVLKREFGEKALMQCLLCELVLHVQQLLGLWTKFHELVPLRVWNCNANVIHGILENLVEKRLNLRRGQCFCQ